MVDKTDLDRELYEAGAFMRALFESAPDSIVVADKSGSIVRVNAKTEIVFGYERDELIGKKLEILIPEKLRKDHVGHRDRYFLSPQTRPMGAGLALLGRRKDGSEFPVDIMLSTLKSSQGDLGIAVVRDITERKQAEEALKSTQESFRLLVTGVKDYAIFMLDPSGHVNSWNEGAERIKGYSAEEIIGKHFSCFYTEEDIKAGKPETILREAAQKGHWEEEGWRTRKDGSSFFADVIVTTIRNDEGVLVGFSKVTRDVTDRKRTDDELRKVIQQREDFVATLTHDLKTPIFAASRAIKLLLDGDFGPLNAEQISVLETILQSDEAMFRLVSTLLDVYRYDAGAKQLVFEHHDLAQEITRLTQELSPIAQEKGIDLKYRSLGATSKTLCDESEIRRVIQNLVDNALKFTPHGGEVEIRLEHAGDITTVSVQDTGKGVSDDDKLRLFQRFWAPPASGRTYASTGLGLYLCRRIVESHGGKIWCESEAGRGSTFTFTLALEQTDAPGDSPAAGNQT
jgi:PAS domain S-box-containing protein